MSMGNVVNQLHDEHRLTHTSATKQADLTTLAERLNQVDDLDTGVQDLLGD